MTLAEFSEKMALHTGTTKRWLQLKQVPTNYYNDINALLGNKYETLDSFRANDQFFTKPEIARYCYDKTIQIVQKLGVDISQYKFIEPSAGCCSFYELLPEDKRIGVDIDPKGELAKELIKSDSKSPFIVDCRFKAQLISFIFKYLFL